MIEDCDDRKAMSLHRGDQKTVEEIAAIMGEKPVEIRERIRRQKELEAVEPKLVVVKGDRAATPPPPA